MNLISLMVFLSLVNCLVFVLRLFLLELRESLDISSRKECFSLNEITTQRIEEGFRADGIPGGEAL